MRCGLVVSALVSRWSSPGSSAVGGGGGGHFVVFLDKTLNYHSAFQWIPANVFRRVSMHGCLRKFV